MCSMWYCRDAGKNSWGGSTQNPACFWFVFAKEKKAWRRRGWMSGLVGTMSPANCGVLPMIWNIYATENTTYGLIHSWHYPALGFLATSFLNPWVWVRLTAVYLAATLLSSKLLSSFPLTAKLEQRAKHTAKHSCRSAHRRATYLWGERIKSPITSSSMELCCALDTDTVKCIKQLFIWTLSLKAPKGIALLSSSILMGQETLIPQPMPRKPSLVDNNNLEIVDFKTSIRKVS